MSHGLTSRPWETAAEPLLHELLRHFGYADKSGAGLLTGTHNLRYCTAAFARKYHSMCLLVPRNVALLTCGGDDVDIIQTTPRKPRVRSYWVHRTGGGTKRFRLARKTNLLPDHPGKDPGQPIPNRWKRLRTPEGISALHCLTGGFVHVLIPVFTHVEGMFGWDSAEQEDGKVPVIFIVGFRISSRCCNHCLAELAPGGSSCSSLQVAQA